MRFTKHIAQISSRTHRFGQPPMPKPSPEISTYMASLAKRRVAGMTQAARTEQARQAALARWAKRAKKDGRPESAND